MLKTWTELLRARGWSFFSYFCIHFFSHSFRLTVNRTYRHSLLVWISANAIILHWYTLIFCCNCLHTSLFQKKESYTSQINQDIEYIDLWTHTDNILWKLLKYKTSHCPQIFKSFKFWFSVTSTITFRLVKPFVSLRLCGVLQFRGVLRSIFYTQKLFWLYIHYIGNDTENHISYFLNDRKVRD